jgi:hypothetical protein
MRLLKVILIFQILVGLYWIIPLTMGPMLGWGGLYLLIAIFVPLLAVVPIAIWSFFKRPATRRLAAVVFFAPLVIFLTPFLIRTAFGDIIGTHEGGFKEASVVIITLIVAVLALLPKRVAEYLPNRLLKSHLFNISLVVGLSVMLVVWIALLPTLKTLIEYDERNIVLAFYAVLYPFVCILITLPILFYSYYSMFQRIDRRHHKLRIAQLVLSLAVLVPSGFGLALIIKLSPLLSPPG